MIPARHSVWIGHGVGAALFVATLLNGLGSFAKRVGVIERESYERYWAYQCGERGTKPVVWRLGRQCVVPGGGAAIERRAFRRLYSSYVFAVQQRERPLKLAKDLVIGGMVLLGTLVTWRHRCWTSRDAWPLWGLLASVVVWTIVAVGRGNTLLALFGLRSFSFLPIALLWVPIASTACLERVTLWCLALALAECALIPWEVLSGVSPLVTFWLPIRFAGTLVHPNTLGVFAVVVLGLGLSFAASRHRTRFWMASLVLVLCSASGVGWVILVVLAIAWLADRLKISVPITVSAATALVVFCLSALSFLTGRHEVLVSATGNRFEALQKAVEQEPMVLVLGQGLGRGTNTAATNLKSPELPSDSAVTLLLRQTGLVGLALFYLSLVFAWRSDRTERPLLLAVLLASLALSITEAFPVNLLLGLALAHSLRPSRWHVDDRAILEAHG